MITMAVIISLALVYGFAIGWLTRGARQICRGCRWWEPHWGGEFEGFCRLSGWYGWAVRPRDDGGTRAGEPAVWAKHDEVRTSPCFGCNQWERRR